MNQWVYKGPASNYESKIIDSEELEAHIKAGWRVSFRENGDGESPLPLPADTPVELEGDLMIEAIASGMKIDKRWSDDTLRAKLDAYNRGQGD